MQSSLALKKILEPKEAVSAILQHVLSKTMSINQTEYFIEGLRIIDKDGKISSEILRRELSSEDQERANTAEKILLGLGGRTAVIIMSQRLNTVNKIDDQLKKSEDAIKDTFTDTIKQAKLNFYFAMIVNIIIVIIGIVLVSFTVLLLSKDPNKFEIWVIPGSSGVFAIIIAGYFNDPRKNARDDLAALLNVNVIFLSFLRRIYQIDAIFKRKYVEGKPFHNEEIDFTMSQIHKTVHDTLSTSEKFISNQKDKCSNKNIIKNNAMTEHQNEGIHSKMDKMDGN